MSAAARKTVISGARVFADGFNGEVADILVEDQKIIRIGNGLDGDRLYEYAGMTLLPGLIDSHVHAAALHDMSPARQMSTPISYRFFLAARNLAAILDGGITTVRDLGGADLGVKRAVADGLIRGPRMKIAIRIIGRTGGYTDTLTASGQRFDVAPPYPGSPNTITDGPVNFRRVVRELRVVGADVAKVALSGSLLGPEHKRGRLELLEDEMQAIGESAAQLGLPIAVHATTAESVRMALRAGASSIEHGIWLDEPAVAAMLSSGAVLVPTLAASHATVQTARQAVERGADRQVLERAEAALASHVASFRLALSAGVRMAMGSDSGNTGHGDNLNELELMVRYGMSAAQAVSAATTQGAKLLGLERSIGSIREGMVADFTIIDGSLSDLKCLPSRVRSVWRSGQEVVSHTATPALS